MVIVWFESPNATVCPIYGRWMTSDPPQVGGGMGGYPPSEKVGPKRVLGNQPFVYKRGTHWEGANRMEYNSIQELIKKIDCWRFGGSVWWLVTSTIGYVRLS